MPPDHSLGFQPNPAATEWNSPCGALANLLLLFPVPLGWGWWQERSSALLNNYRTLGFCSSRPDQTGITRANCHLEWSVPRILGSLCLHHCDKEACAALTL